VFLDELAQCKFEIDKVSEDVACEGDHVVLGFRCHGDSVDVLHDGGLGVNSSLLDTPEGRTIHTGNGENVNVFDNSVEIDDMMVNLSEFLVNRQNFLQVLHNNLEFDQSVDFVTFHFLWMGWNFKVFIENLFYFGIFSTSELKCKYVWLGFYIRVRM
jgi:hypothetical protein